MKAKIGNDESVPDNSFKADASGPAQLQRQAQMTMTLQDIEKLVKAEVA